MVGKWMVVAAMALAGVGFGGNAAMAAKGDKKAQKLEQRTQEQVADRMPAERLKEALADLNLTDDQKAKVDEILKPFTEEADKWRTDHKEEIEKVKADMVEAREAKDKEKAKAARQELRKLMESAPKPREVLDKLKDVLTPEQVEKLKAKVEAVKEKRRGK